MSVVALQTHPATSLTIHTARDLQHAGWVAPQPRRNLLRPTIDRPQARPRAAVQPRALSGAAAELATYHLAQRQAGATSEWFQTAVREVVKHIDEAPVLQTVQLGLNGASPKCSTYSVHDSVVAVPELWQGIAEHVSQHLPDVVILAQRVSPHASAGSPQGAMDGATASSQQQQQQQGTVVSSPSASPPGSPRGGMRSSGSLEMHAEEACRRLVSSGVADAILLHGQVGDCCDGEEGHSHHHNHHQQEQQQPGTAANGAAGGEAARQQSPSRPLPLPNIVPFSPSGSPSRRAAVRTAALHPVGSGSSNGSSACQQSTCYWGLVVQSRLHTGAEGCYLLKTVRNVSPGTDCSCTHFSLTRISHGEHLEQQFVQSWLL